MILKGAPATLSKAELARLERELSAREARLNRLITDRRYAECEEFASYLVRVGIFDKSMESTARMLLARAPNDLKENFVEGEPPMTQYEAMRFAFGALPRYVSVGVLHGKPVQVLADPSMEGLTRGADHMVKIFADAGQPIDFANAVFAVKQGLGHVRH